MNKTIKFLRNKNIIKLKSIIISTIFLSIILLSSCAAPRSVRPTSSYLSSKKQYIIKPIKEIRNKNNYTGEATKGNTETNQNQKAIAGLNNTNLDSNGLPIKKTPSLNKQIELLFENNVKMQKDIEIIKKSINQINQKINNFKNNESQSHKTGNKTVNPITPSNNRKNLNMRNRDFQNPVDSYNTNAHDLPDNGNIILSDEENQKLEKIDFGDKFKHHKTINPIQFKPNKRNIPKKKNTQKPKESSQLIPSSQQNSSNTIQTVQSVINSKNYQDAIKKLTKLLNKTKDPVEITICYFYLGESHYGLNQFDKAIDYFKKVLENDNTNKNDDAQFKIAQAYYRLGNIKEAKKEYKIFVVKYPKSEKIPEARKILQQI